MPYDDAPLTSEHELASVTVGPLERLDGPVHLTGPNQSPGRPTVGLHLVDGNIAQGDLVKVVRRQIRAHGRR